MTALDRLLAGTGWRIAEPALLVALLAAVLATAIVGAVGVARRRALLRRSFGRVGSRVAPRATAGRRIARLTLACGGLALLAIAAARPQVGLRAEEVQVRGMDLVILLDASRSMLARDAAPDRLALAKQEIASLLGRMAGVRVSLIAFAGSAELRAPLTTDIRAAKLLLSAVDPATMQIQGTDVAQALQVARRALAPAAPHGAARAALLVSDGEDHGRGADDAAERLALAGIPLFTAAVGTAGGAPVPRAAGGAFLDEGGRMVLSRLDEDRLAELAARGGGRHVRLDGSGAATEQLTSELRRLERSSSRTTRVRAWDERFARVALLGVVLLAAGAALPETSRRRARSRRAAMLVAGSCVAVLLAGAAPFLAEHEGLAEANALVDRDPEAALRVMDAVERELGPRPEIDVNRGIALFRAGRLSEARRSFSLAGQARGALASRGVYAEGVAALAEGDAEAALAAWRRALVLDPRNDAARFNLEVLLRRAQAAEPHRGEASGHQELSRGAESRAGDRDTPERDPTAEPHRGEAASGRQELSRGAESRAGDRDTPERDPSASADTTPMPLAEAERLLDSVAASERVMPMAPTRGPRVTAPSKPW